MGDAKRCQQRQLDRGQGISEIPVDEFGVPDGMVAFTLDVHDINPFTLCIEAAELIVMLRDIEQGLDPEGKACHDLEHYAKLRSFLIATLRRANASGEDKMPPSMAVLWCVFNHPEGSDVVRRRVSEALRRTGKAHITMACDVKERVAVAVSDKFVEMTQLMASAPDTVRVWVAERKSETTSMH
jgi:hypothetical protein